MTGDPFDESVVDMRQQERGDMVGEWCERTGEELDDEFPPTSLAERLEQPRTRRPDGLDLGL